MAFNLAKLETLMGSLSLGIKSAFVAILASAKKIFVESEVDDERADYTGIIGHLYVVNCDGKKHKVGADMLTQSLLLAEKYEEISSIMENLSGEGATKFRNALKRQILKLKKANTKDAKKK